MKKIGFVPNMDKDIGLATTMELIDFICEKGCEAYVSQEIYGLLKKKNVLASENIYTMVDFLIVLGGDGTMLQAARNAAQYNTPLIGINLGKLGYLTDVEKLDSKISIQKVLDGNYKLEKRMMLEATMSGCANEMKHIALNDICITRGALTKLIGCEISVNGEYMNTYSADGIIVCTPTGSTAYNLAAGGPILKPDSEMMAITPICPHALYARSSVISHNDVIGIQITDNSTDVIVSMDGQMIRPATNDSEIRIKRSDYYTTIIKTNNYGFYDILRLKMLNR